MGNSATPADTVIPALVVGIDWADQKHDLYWIDASGQSGRRTVDQTPQAIEELVAWMTEKAGGGPIALALEKSRGPLQNALMGLLRPGPLPSATTRATTPPAKIPR
jgi:hypothetical protein